MRGKLLLSVLALGLIGPASAQSDTPSGEAPAHAPDAVDPLAPAPGAEKGGGGIEAAPKPPAPIETPKEQPPPPETDDDDFGLPRTLLGWTPPGKLYDEAADWKTERIPLVFGAWHWLHINNQGPIGTEYGIPGQRGTFFYYLRFDPELTTTSEDFPKVGAHIDFRFRDDTDRFRRFFESNYWLWEAYAWVDTPAGRLKGGKVWRRFGLDWDGCWWGNVPYFDGLKLDPDLGLSLESTFAPGGGVKLDTFAQFFFRDDRVNGSLVGADPESVRRSSERDTTVVRVVPSFGDEELNLAIGLSGQVGRVLNRRRPGATRGVDDELVGAVALDVTVGIGPFKAFVEATQEWGVKSPAHYVTGGPSNKRATGLAGASFQIGPVTLRAIETFGWYDNPAGWQASTVVGGTLAITKNVDIYAEYVHWETHGGGGTDSFATFENGFQLIFHWQF
jgi:hypothetical protein